MTTNRGILRDRDGDGEITKEEIWLNLMEAGWMRTVGQPVASGIIAGLGATAALAALFNLMYEAGIHHDEMLYRDAWMLGAIVGGLWIVLEMYSIRTNQMGEEYQRGYERGVEETEMKYAAELSRLNDALSAARSRGETVSGEDGLTDNDRKFIAGGTAFLNFLWDAKSKTTKDAFPKAGGVPQSMWKTIRDRFVALGVINEGRDVLGTRTDAQQAWEDHVQGIKNTRQRGGVPAL